MTSKEIVITLILISYCNSKMVKYRFFLWNLLKSDLCKFKLGLSVAQDISIQLKPI